MEVDVLGPLSVSQESASIVPTASKPRTVLALLAVRANRFVALSSLMDELWIAEKPPSARTAMQSYILHLRKKIAAGSKRRPDGSVPEAKDVLVTMPGGYLLKAADDHVVLDNFEVLAAAGHRAREQGDFQAASENFARALGLCRGRTLADVQVGPHLRMEVERIEEARLNVLDRRIESDLRLGRHHELLSELRSIIAAHPTHEGLCAHLMLALYRSGRRSEALEVYQRMRATLVSELGLEPSPALRRLQRSMLISDHGLSELNVTWDVSTF
ncbi:BTAD domain-containing putative transcriptional regulator [Streptomyces sp. NPDC059176]|uniref:AfsR/SARP family transcriptional regulator n=1 Tax=unclassified Streptomyces TaxID=2593676 RepID=UPI0036848128